MCLIDILHATHQQLLQQLEALLLDARRRHFDQPRLIAARLQQHIDDACNVYTALRGFAPQLRVEADAHTLRIADEAGFLTLRWTEHGWTSAPLGLHSRHLAACIAAWPSLRIPQNPRIDPNPAIRDLRELFAAPDEDAIEHVASLLENHLSPIVHDYAKRHIDAWPPHLRDALDQYQRSAFAEQGIALLRAQTRGTLAAALQSADGATRDALQDTLQATLIPAFEAWRSLLDLRTNLTFSSWSDTTLLISTLADDSYLTLYQQPSGAWRTSPTDDLACSTERILELLDRIPPRHPLAFLESEEDQDDWLELDELADDPREDAFIRAYNHIHYPHLDADAEDERDELYNDEEHWLLHACLEGLERGQLDDDEVEDDEDSDDGRFRRWRSYPAPPSSWSTAS